MLMMVFVMMFCMLMLVFVMMLMLTTVTMMMCHIFTVSLISRCKDTAHLLQLGCKLNYLAKSWSRKV